ncbi:ribosome small subunit-dependent GTPase A [soil metagenome]
MLEGFDVLVPFGWDERVATLYRSVAAGDHEPGRVVRVERGSCLVQCAAGSRSGVGDPPPAVGDWVALGTSGHEPAPVEAILDRWSVLSRQDPAREAEQVLASNLDLILIVAPADRLHLARVERELLVAWESGARPVVVLTKADLVDDPEGVRISAEQRLVGTEVILTSPMTGEGIDEVAKVLQPNRSGALLGPSGAGKSSLANALLGEDALAIGDVRDQDRRGRHTTTTRQLMPLPNGGVLIDAPGLRSLILWRGDHGLSAAFRDVEELAEVCRFGDCHHDREPGCAVKEAVAAGTLDRQRFSSYRKLQGEVVFAERAHDVRARQAEQQSGKSVSKGQRQGRGRGRPR